MGNDRIEEQMRLARYILATVLVGGALVWVIFAEEKGIAIGAGIIAVFLVRMLVVEAEGK